MLIQFPSGSNKDTDDIIGFITFRREGTWSFLPGDIDLNPEDPDVKRMTEAIDYFAFVMTQDDVVSRFWDSQKDKHAEFIDEWRRENIKLVPNIYCSTETKEE